MIIHLILIIITLLQRCLLIDNNIYLNPQFQFEEVDIKAKGNETWFEKYRYEIPVFHLNGSFLMKHRVNEEILERELSKFEEQQRG